MASADGARTPYVIPRYHEDGDPAWYHVLHGTVPGHQIDFMYCPDVPQGRLTQTHFGHLARLMKYIEPRQNAPYAFALGNLSRDDIQHEPGHGGLALIFALRVAGVTDHAGRAMPPYAHGVLAIDRAFDHSTLREAISTFYRRFLEGDSQAEDATGSFYRAYVRVMRDRPEDVERFLHEYVSDFDDLPQPQQSHLGWDWEADEEALPRRVTIVHADDEPFDKVANAAARLGSMLYRSNIKWTTITSGREIEIPGGISIRFVPASEAPRDAKGLVLPLRELPDQEDALATTIFGAKSRHVETKVARAGWRVALGAPKVEETAVADSTVNDDSVSPQAPTRPPTPRSTPPAEIASSAQVDVDFDEAATIPAALEPDPAPAPAPKPSSPPTAAATAFDPRRSSPATGVTAATAKTASISPPAKIDSMSPPSHGPAASAIATFPNTAPKARLGIVLGVLAGLAVIAALIFVLGGGSGEGSAGSGSTTGAARLNSAGSSTTITAQPPAPSTAVSSHEPVLPNTATTAVPPPSVSVAQPSQTTSSPPVATDVTPQPRPPSTAVVPKPTATVTKTPGGMRGPLRL